MSDSALGVMAAEDWRGTFFHHPFDSRLLGLQAVGFITALAISGGVAALLLLKNYVLDSMHGKSNDGTEDLRFRAYGRSNDGSESSSPLWSFRSLFRSVVSSEKSDVVEDLSCGSSRDKIRKERQYSAVGEGDELSIGIDCNWSSVPCTFKRVTSPSDPAAKNSDACNEKTQQLVSKKESTENLGMRMKNIVTQRFPMTTIYGCVENKQRPVFKKVRFAADVVEPSANNREYRRRVKSALVIKGAAAYNERSSSMKRHHGNLQCSGSSVQGNAQASDLNSTSNSIHPGIARSLFDVVQNHRSQAHQRRTVHVMACDDKFFSDSKPTSEENQRISVGASHRQIGSSQPAGHPWILQRELGTRNDLKFSVDPNRDTTQDLSCAGHHKNINMSPPHQWKLQTTLATSSLPANRMALYNGIQQYRLQGSQYC
eukprot:c24149_g1_i1 orf=595-1878(+)